MITIKSIKFGIDSTTFQIKFMPSICSPYHCQGVGSSKLHKKKLNFLVLDFLQGTVIRFSWHITTGIHSNNLSLYLHMINSTIIGFFVTESSRYTKDLIQFQTMNCWAMPLGLEPVVDLPAHPLRTMLSYPLFHCILMTLYFSKCQSVQLLIHKIQ